MTITINFQIRLRKRQGWKEINKNKRKKNPLFQNQISHSNNQISNLKFECNPNNVIVNNTFIWGDILVLNRRDIWREKQ